MAIHRRSAPKKSRVKTEKIPEHLVPGNLAERRWKQVQQELRYYWKCLDEDDVLRIAGKRDELLRILHEKYGYTPARAGKELSDVLATPRRKK
jgi:hypothetical protein